MTCEALESRLLLAGDLQVRFQFLEAGSPVESLVVGRTYDLAVLVQDARATPSGVLQAYFDVSYNASLLSAQGGVVAGAAYALNAGGDTSMAGLIDEAGGVDSDRLPPDPRGAEVTLFRTAVRAEGAGTLQLTADLSERSPNQPFFFGEFNAIRLDQIEFVGGTVQIVQQAAPRVSITRARDGSEQGSLAGVFTVTQALPTAIDTVVSYTVGGTAAAGQDFQALSGSVRIAAGQTSASINVPVINDALVEADESVVVTLASIVSGASNVVLNPAAVQASLTIADNDSALISVARSSDGSEAGPVNGVFVVTQSARSSSPTTISYALNGSASAGGDYEAPGGTVTIPSGATNAQVVIAVRDDNSLEGPESVTMRLTAVNSGDPQIAMDGSHNQATLTIEDNDVSLVSIATLNDGSEQGSAAGRFGINLSRSSPSATVIAYTVMGSATSGADYTPLSGTVSVAAGSTSAVINVAPLNDTLVEGPETVEVRLSQITSGNAQVQLDSAHRTATLNLADNDTATVRITTISNGNELGPSAGAFRVTQTSLSAQPTVVRYSVNGTAVAGQDFQTLSGMVTIPAGALAVDIPVNVLDDSAVEGAESVVVSLEQVTSGSPGVQLDATNRQATVTIADDEQAQVTVERVADGSEDGPAPASFRVRQPFATSTNTVIAYALSGSATPGQDFGALSGSVTIAAGQTSATVNVTVIDDGLLEGPEALTLTLTAITSGNSQLAISPAANQATIAIADNDFAKVSITGGVISEAVDGVFRVGQSLAAPVDTVVRYTVNGSATPTADYAPLSGTVMIPAGQTTASIAVDVVQDLLVENNETIALQLAEIVSGSSQVQLDPAASAATLTLTDDDTATLSLQPNADGAEAGAIAGSFELTLSKASSTSTVVSFSVAGEAVSGQDYTPLSGSATIPAGSLTALISVMVLDDTVSEGNESVVLTLTGITQGDSDIILSPSASQATIRILDDESPRVRITKDRDGAEGGVAGRFLVQQTIATSTPTVVQYTVGGVAVNGADYSTLSGSITIPAGSVSAELSVNALDDAQAEGAESVVVNLTGIASGDSALVLDESARNAELLIADNESGLISLTATQAELAEGGPNGSFLLRQGGQTSTDTVVTYSVSGSASPGVDYVTFSGQATIAAGQTQTLIPIELLNDAIVEGPEDLRLTLTGISSGDAILQVDPQQDAAALVINDDDTSVVSLGLGQDGGESAGDLRFVVTLTQASSTDTTIAYAISGSAANGADYQTLSGQVVIPAGQLMADVIASVIDDLLVEPEEAVTLELTGVSAGNPRIALHPFNRQATASLADNDQSLVSVQTQRSGNEGGLDVVFLLSLTQPSSSDTQLSFTLQGTATPGSDYSTPTSLQVLIPAGETNVSLELSVVQDVLLEGEETIALQLQTVSGLPQVLLDVANTQAEAYIGDDETGLVSVIGATDGQEPNVSGQFIVRQSGVTDQATVVAYEVSGTAGSGVDYSALAGEIIIPAGMESAEIDVSVIDDDLIEGSESVVLTLTGISAGDERLRLDSAATTDSIILLDDDSALLSIVANDESLSEGGVSAGFTVRQAGVAQLDTVVDYTVSGTAVAGQDYATLSGSVRIAAGTTSAEIPLTLIDDAIVEGPESLIVRLSEIQSGSPQVAIDPAQQQVETIIGDNDMASVALVSTRSGSEGGINAEFTVTQSLPSSADTVVRLMIGGSALLNEDYRLAAAQATIPAGQTQVTVVAEVIDDQRVEGAEDVILTLSQIESGNLGVALDPLQNQGRATITDNDIALIGFAQSSSTALEAAGSHRVAVRLSVPGGGSLQDAAIIQVSAGGGASTAEDADYVLNTAQLVFPAGSRDGEVREIMLTLTQDSIQEESESLELRLEVTDAADVVSLGGVVLHTVELTDDPSTASISGRVWSDANVNGRWDGNEAALPGVTVLLSGSDALGRDVQGELMTDPTGLYRFDHLPAGVYQVRQLQPIAFSDGAEHLGTVAGLTVGRVGADQFSEIRLEPTQAGANYNFAEGGPRARYITPRLFLTSTPSLTATMARDLIVQAEQREGSPARANVIQRTAAPSYLKVGTSVIVTLADTPDRVTLKPAEGAGATSRHVVTFASGLTWNFAAAEVNDIQLVGVGANDQLTVYDTVGDDHLQVQGDQLFMEAAGGAYQVRAEGFTRVRAVAAAGGVDASERLALIDFVLEQEGAWNV